MKSAQQGTLAQPSGSDDDFSPFQTRSHLKARAGGAVDSGTVGESGGYMVDGEPSALDILNAMSISPGRPVGSLSASLEQVKGPASSLADSTVALLDSVMGMQEAPESAADNLFGRLCERCAALDPPGGLEPLLQPSTCIPSFLCRTCFASTKARVHTAVPPPPPPAPHSGATAPVNPAVPPAARRGSAPGGSVPPPPPPSRALRPLAEVTE